MRYLGFSFVLICLLCACQPEERVAYAPLGAVPPEPQRPGDPQKGREALLNEAYITCGLPLSVYRRLAPPVPTQQRLPERRGINAQLPYHRTHYRTRDSVDLVVPNCLNCHAATINGQLIIGLGNERLDFTNDPRPALESAGLYLTDPKEIAQWRKWLGILDAILPAMRTDTVGVNPAISITLALMAHRDPRTLAWSDEPLMEPPAKPIPASVPPWWRIAKKNALYYNAEGRGDHARAMMLGAIMCADDVATLQRIDRYAPDIRAYLASLEPPKFPWPIDGKLAQQGRKVFEQHCSRCHGTYGEHSSYPNLVIGVEQVGTDPLLAQRGTDGSSDRFIRWFNRSFFGQLSRAQPAPGYMPPPLDGIWATAPFLHNGSVPTLAALLDSRKRPRYWRYVDERYDPVQIGWFYQSLPYGKDGAESEAERRHIYDTTLPGYGNQGHTFGDVLTEDQRRALLEYLKTL